MISLLVPVYNAQEHIPVLLACLRGQTVCRDFELILVDDGSSDASLSLCQAAQAQEPFPVRVFSRENGGVSRARNTALSQAAGEWAAFVDVDDLLTPAYVEGLMKLSEERADMARYGFARVDAAARDMTADGWQPPSTVTQAELATAFLREPKAFGPYGFLFRTAFLRENHLTFAEGYAYYEDYDFLLRAIACAQRLCATATCLYGYRQAAGSAMMRYSVERVRCLRLAEETCAFLQRKAPAVAEVVALYPARLYWSALWQACVVLRSPQAVRRFLDRTHGRPRLESLYACPDRRVALTSRLACLAPWAFYALARRLSRGRTLLAPFSAEEEQAFFARLEAM